jgi:hypothetical protein
MTVSSTLEGARYVVPVLLASRELGLVSDSGGEDAGEGGVLDLEDAASDYLTRGTLGRHARSPVADAPRVSLS